MPTLLLACHACAIGAVAWLALSLGLPLSGAAGVSVILLTPLVLAVNGLWHGARYTRQWLAIAMVFYVGGGLAETIASQGRSSAAVAVFFIAAVELGLLLRSLRHGPRAPRESTGS